MAEGDRTTNTDDRPVPGSTETFVLAVDDDPIQRDLYGIYLAAAAFRVVAAETGEIALGELARHDFALAVVDYDMPGMDGLELIRRLRADPRFAERPILVVTGREDLVSAQRVMEAGATAMLLKPVLWRTLGDRVRSMITAARPASH